MIQITNFNHIYFLSDAHLGAPIGASEEERERLLFAFGEGIAHRENHLFILGDLFDFWFEWKKVIPKKHFRVLRKLASWADNGLKLYYLAGNHDFSLSGFLEKEIGFATFLNTVEFTAEGKKFHLFHGDGVQKSDVGYRILKKVFRCRLNQKLYRLLHPDLGIALADWSSSRSRESQLLKNPSQAEYDYFAYAQAKIAQGFDFVIMGHTHRPLLHKFPQGIYLNAGNWYTDFSYGVYQRGELSLNYFKCDVG